MKSLKTRLKRIEEALGQQQDADIILIASLADLVAICSAFGQHGNPDSHKTIMFSPQLQPLIKNLQGETK